MNTYMNIAFFRIPSYQSVYCNLLYIIGSRTMRFQRKQPRKEFFFQSGFVQHRDRLKFPVRWLFITFAVIKPETIYPTLHLFYIALSGTVLKTVKEVHLSHHSYYALKFPLWSQSLSLICCVPCVEMCLCLTWIRSSHVCHPCDVKNFLASRSKDD